MVNTLRFASAVAATMLMGACTKASFSGGANSRAHGPNPTEGSLQLSCSVPEAVKTGADVAIDVKVKGWNGEVFQKVMLPGKDPVDTKLVKADAGYVAEGSESNSIKAEADGDVKIELRRMKDQKEADASCSFVANKDGTTPPGTKTPTGEEEKEKEKEKVTEPKVCEPSQQSIGAQIAFLIDNSNSNAATDCAGAKKVGTFNGTDTYECGKQTNREAAILAAYDLLAKIAADQPGNAKARSDLAIASFPTQADYVNGWEQESKGWISVDANARTVAENAMLFARKPSGLTPYGAAMTAATELFKNASNDGRAKVAVLVTDGEPTDRDPSAVQAQADALKAQGVNVIVLTYNQTHANRVTEHTAMMRKIEDSQLPQHWYNTAKYGSFDDYLKALIGVGGQGGLVATLANPAKQIEVQDSAALKDAFLKIIKTQAIGCEK